VQKTIPPDVDAALKTFVEELCKILEKDSTKDTALLKEARNIFWTALEKHKLAASKKG
jgi:hypothetical protein